MFDNLCCTWFSVIKVEDNKQTGKDIVRNQQDGIFSNLVIIRKLGGSQ